METKELTVQQQRFVDGILKGLTQEEAYVQAGYKSRGARARACSTRLLANVSVMLAIKEGRKADREDALVTRDRIIKEYAKIAFCDVVNIFDKDGNIKNIHDIDPDTRAAICAIDVVETPLDEWGFKTIRKYKLETKKGALDSLAKIKGMFVDRHQIDFNSETLRAILGGLPEELSIEVRAALLALVKK
jgi:phage terminase small subunit